MHTHDLPGDRHLTRGLPNKILPRMHTLPASTAELRSVPSHPSKRSQPSACNTSADGLNGGSPRPAHSRMYAPSRPPPPVTTCFNLTQPCTSRLHAMAMVAVRTLPCRKLLRVLYLLSSSLLSCTDSPSPSP